MKVFFYRHNKRKPMDEIHNKISFYDLTVFFDGNGEYVIDDVEYKINSGDAILVPPDSVRIRRPLINADYVSVNFYSDEKLDMPIYLPNILGNTLKHTIAALDANFIKHADTTNELFNKLFDCVLLEIDEKLKSKSLNQTVEKIKYYVLEHLDEKIKLSDIGNFVYLSPIYCDLLFKKETGKSIIDFTLDEKIKKAENMLLEGGAKLTVVAEQTGFSDYNYFSRVFKKRIGYTPSEYKKMYFPKSEDN